MTILKTSNREEAVLLHTNDLHFNFNHRTIFLETVKNIRAASENVFLMDAGDIFVRQERYWPEGGIEFYKNRGRYMTDAMNEAGYDAMTLGNNELDYKGAVTRDNLRHAKFHKLGANVKVDAEDFDQPEPYIILKTAGGHTVAVLGLAIQDKGGYPPGIHIRPPEETLGNYLYLREKYNALVLLTHLGAPRDRELAAQFGGIAAIIGGQSHKLLNPAEMVNGSLVCQAGGHTPRKMDPTKPRHLGVIRFWFEDGKVVKKTGEVITMEPTPEL